jgi:hypothetical protein
MPKQGGAFRNLMIWTHERGTLPYDIICALILAFIFFVPKSCFVNKRTANPAGKGLETVQRAGANKTNDSVPRLTNLP